jgi:predicted amidohydrolase YtcJ
VPGSPPASALAVSGGRIVGLGSDADVDPLIGPTTTVIRLQGETVLPGFQDAHIHPIYGGLLEFQCSLHGLPDLASYRAAIRAFADAHPEAAWIEGDGWDYPVFPGGRPSREILDGVVADRPVFINAFDGHSAWVNSRALELAGITATTPDPPNGRIERDAEGVPTGVLVEDAVILLGDVLPRPTDERLLAALLGAQRHLHGLGITAWHDAGANPEWLGAYQSASATELLTARVTVAQQWQPWGRTREADPMPRLEAARAATSGERLRSDVVKFWLDGVIENRTAVLLEPYFVPDGQPGADGGTPAYQTDALQAAVSDLERRGFDCHFHAIGEGAVRQALDAVEAAHRVNGDTGRRHTVAHLERIHPDDIGRFRTGGGQPAAVLGSRRRWNARRRGAAHRPGPVSRPLSVRRPQSVGRAACRRQRLDGHHRQPTGGNGGRNPAHLPDPA